MAGYRPGMTSPTGKRPRNLFFYGAVALFLALMLLLALGNLTLAVVAGVLAVGCVFAGARPTGGT